MEYYSAIKKKEIMPTTGMWSKSERERQIPHDITNMWNLKYDTNEPIYETEIVLQI